ncbi:MAG: DUF2202 domain-containing protein [Candidatus Aminicenantes bacterium]|nr:DUF2202 domain-containing protein [Candidatus Aminicenantes bacterium]MCK5004399.1 DUF2202 domain-containing protein [Candidatus Aminicenantes bacterium]
MEQYIGSFPYEEISDDEKTSLLHMREEEKLARDVYNYLYERWGMRIFDNISLAEQMHMDAIATILQKYDIPDPVLSDDDRGTFSDEGLKELYTTLITKGNNSITDALLVGATIEDLDIFDLQNALLKVDNMDILFVFGNLKKGSENHIRAFSSQLMGFNIIYTAQYISQDELDIILSSSTNGRGRGRNN